MFGKRYSFRQLLKYRCLKKDMLKEFRDWSKGNPQKNFGAFYVEREAVKAKDQTSEHVSLGTNLNTGDFKKAGLDKYEKLKNWGLRERHVCVDYGCGSLRIGQHVIKALAPGHYYGLDITDQFFNIGKEMLGQELIQQKKPQLSIIGDSVLDTIANRGVDYIFSNGVLIHVPPFELTNYFTKILSLLGPTTKLYIGMASYKENLQISPMSWAYTQSHIQQQILSIDAQLNIEFLNFQDYSKSTILGTKVIRRGTIFISRKPA
ncbi:MAG: hypothetical protein ACI8YQ_001250 [Polaribacter sp.]|jgi:hypothetical protein